MTTLISEEQFEKHIQGFLVDTHGYVTRPSSQFDKKYAVDGELIAQFLAQTQPEQRERYIDYYGDEIAVSSLSKRVDDTIRKYGVLHLLRRGFRDGPCSFTMFYPRPENTLNPHVAKDFGGNIFSVMRQCRYSHRNDNSIDLVLFVNGIPLITMELKTALTGQTVADAIKQYKSDRNPQETLLQFKRTLVHLAVDTNQAYMCTKLDGLNSWFLPFNQGFNGGAGNPPSPDGSDYATSYLWNDIFSPTTLSDLITHFVLVEKTVEKDALGKQKTKEVQIFPRYHQLDVVRKLLADVKVRGAGTNYLIQHSAGSGKSNSIAWLSHRLVSLHNEDDENIFDSIIIITDRRVLDSQLQQTVGKFQSVAGTVKKITKGSAQLREALEAGEKIIITTVQKFPFIVEYIGALKQQKFAVIIDEAHSSQTGETVKAMKLVLRNNQSSEEDTNDERESTEDVILEHMKSRGKADNVSYFAFTATPKPKTLERFGTKQYDGQYMPFHLYSMRQAIQEGFILDVLKNYTTFNVYWSLVKEAQNDPQYNTRDAKRVLMSYVDKHEHTIRQKIEIIVNHFVKNSMNQIGGKAKAMIVTKSRPHAVMFKLAIDKYLEEQGYNSIKALVAFSGTVTDAETNIEYTESNMNGFGESKTKEIFRKSEYRFLIVANKFQTGFDEPLLNTMYVDKKLGGVQAVQTLSRLNRVHNEKDSTFVLDFVNDVDTVKEAFQPYYEGTVLSESTDPNRLHNIYEEIMQYGLFGEEDIDKFNDAFFTNQGQELLYAILSPIVVKFNTMAVEDKSLIKRLIDQYVKDYAFISQLLTFADISLEKMYVFSRLLVKSLVIEGKQLPYEIVQDIDMEAFKIKQNPTIDIELEADAAEPFSPLGANGGRGGAEEEIDPLSAIINDLNDKFGDELTEQDRIKLNTMMKNIMNTEDFKHVVENNTQDKAFIEFGQHFNKELAGTVSDSMNFYKKVKDSEDMTDYIMHRMFTYIRNQMTSPTP